MNAQLGEVPATIGRVRQLGALAVIVTCNAPCRRQASLMLDALRLPDNTPFGAIAERRRLRGMRATCAPDLRRLGRDRSASR